MNKARYIKVVIGSLLMCALTTGTYNVLTVFVKPISQAVNASVTQVSLIFSVVALSMFVAGIISGPLMKKFKIKLIGSAAGVMYILFFLIISLAKNIFVMQLAGLIFGFAVVIGGYALAQTVLTWWFVTHRGKLISSTTVAIALLVMVLAPLTAKMIESVGVRDAALYYGLIVGGLMILNSLFLLSEHPDKYDMKPYGYTEEQRIKEEESKKAKLEVQDGSLSLKQVLGLPAFWLIIAGTIIAGIGTSGFTISQSVYYQSLGINAVQAALCVSVYNLMRNFWNLSYGALVDKFGVRKITIAFALILTIFYFIAIYLKGFIGAVLAAGILSIATFRSPIIPIAFPKMFGSKTAADMIGYSNTVAAVGVMVGTPLAGYIYDAMGSFNRYLIVASILSFVLVVTFLIGTGKKAVDKIKSISPELDIKL